MQTDRPIWRWLGWAAFAVLLVVPIGASLLSPFQTGRSLTWMLATLAGILALSLLVVQMVLPTHGLYVMLRARNLRWHHRLGLVVVGLVVAHVGGLYLYSPDDISDALLLRAPTYSRLGVLSASCLLLTVVLALLRRRLPLTLDDWQIAHSVLAVTVTGLAVGHVVMLQGTLDGPAEWLLCIAAVVAVMVGVIYWHVLRPMRRSRPIR